jgi:hypothetical protein
MLNFEHSKTSPFKIITKKRKHENDNELVLNPGRNITVKHFICGEPFKPCKLIVSVSDEFSTDQILIRFSDKTFSNTFLLSRHIRASKQAVFNTLVSDDQFSSLALNKLKESICGKGTPDELVEIRLQSANFKSFVTMVQIVPMTNDVPTRSAGQYIASMTIYSKASIHEVKDAACDQFF